MYTSGTSEIQSDFFLHFELVIKVRQKFFPHTLLGP